MPITKEDARRVLKEEKLPPFMHKYFKAIVEGTQPKYYLNEFRQTKSYSDVLISDYESLVKQQYSGNENIKARANVILWICLQLDSLVEQEIIKDEKLIAQIGAFRHRGWNCFKGKKGEYFTTPEELKIINTMLDTVIDYLKAAYSLK